jgi:opacity protein-like surface antigen
MFRLIARIVMASAVLITAAQAADLPPPAYPPMVQPVPAPFASGWYLRGDVGAGLVRAQQFQYVPNPLNVNDFAINHFSLGDVFLADVGVGYQFNSWLRFDVTAEWRSQSKFYGIGSYTMFCPVLNCDDVYNANLQSKILLANAYLDLGNWYGVTPFIGLGIGTAYNSILNLRDFGPQTGGSGSAHDTSVADFAWAFHAGVALDITRNLKLEASYRYLSYGSPQTQIFCVGGCNPDTYRFRDLYSNDFRLGVRWMFEGFEPLPVYEPLVRKG